MAAAAQTGTAQKLNVLLLTVHVTESMSCFELQMQQWSWLSLTATLAAAAAGAAAAAATHLLLLQHSQLLYCHVHR
jgi:hypothetical protein